VVVLLLVIIALQCPLYENEKTYAQCCGSGMFIPDPDFYLSGSGSDLITAPKEEGEKFFLPFFVATG
jgi:hypothetical protein